MTEDFCNPTRDPSSRKPTSAIHSVDRVGRARICAVKGRGLQLQDAQGRLVPDAHRVERRYPPALGCGYQRSISVEEAPAAVLHGTDEREVNPPPALIPQTLPCRISSRWSGFPTSYCPLGNPLRSFAFAGRHEQTVVAPQTPCDVVGSLGTVSCPDCHSSSGHSRRPLDSINHRGAARQSMLAGRLSGAIGAGEE